MPRNELYVCAPMGKDNVRLGQCRESSTVIRPFLLAVLSASSVECICVRPGMVGRLSGCRESTVRI
jgi:hypothetical protein